MSFNARGCLFAIGVAAAMSASSDRAFAVPIYGTNTNIQLSGSRTVGNGLTGNAAWATAGALTVSWNISFDANTQLYTYQYRIQATAGGATSHFIIDLTDDCVVDQIAGCTNGFGSYGAFTSSNGNPGLPSPGIIGVKYDVPQSEQAMDITYSFTSTRAPVWGDVYVKDGGGTSPTSAIYAYNNGITAHATSMNIQDFIARPNGDQSEEEVPEPGTYALIGGALVALALARRKAA